MTKPTGFTLLEVLAVMSLLVVASALLVPSLQRWQRDISLQQAVSAVRGGLNQARLAAIDSAQPKAFVFEPEGGRFGVVDDAATTMAAWQFQLPPGTQFVAPTDRASGHSAVSAPCWFRPDGTGTDFVFWVQDSSGSRHRLTVRRLTGGVSCELD